jgi:hypothetical protein
MTPENAIYSHDIVLDLPDTLQKCILDALTRVVSDTGIEQELIDIRVHLQSWRNTACGFPSVPLDDVLTLAPTFVLKFSKTLRYVYHAGKFAYSVTGRVSVQYYNNIMTRKLPGAEELDMQRMLNS